MAQDLIPIENPQPAVLFAPGGLDDLLARIETDARALVPDISTKKGRDAIASNAARVARTKTYLDGIGKDYVAELKAMPRKIDAERKRMRDRLDSLRDEVRQPLTEFEAAEIERVERHRDRIARIRSATDGLDMLSLDERCTKANERILKLQDLVIDESWQEFQEEACRERDASLFRLQKDLAQAQEEIRVAQEREKARLEREAKEREEREARIAREAAERAKAEEVARAAAEIAHAKAEQERAERMAREAEERAKAQAQEAARIEQQRLAEQAARERDAEHRKKIRAEAFAALRQHIDIKSASTMLNKIDAGAIPHVSINY